MTNKIFTLSIVLILLLSFTKMSGQIPFKLNEAGHIIIKAEINGVEGKFIFDTGAGLNIIFKKFSEKIELDKTVNFFVGHRATGEALSLDLYNVRNLKINSKEFNQQQYAIIDLEYEDIDGLISLQPFRDTTITINYIKKELLFNKPTHNEKYIDIKVMDYAGKAIDIFTDIKLNNFVKIQVLLDSGAGQKSFWFSSKLLEPLKLDKENFMSAPVTSDFEQQNNYYFGKLKRLTTDKNFHNLENLEVAFVDGLIYEGKTSIEWLGKILTIDIANKKIFIEK